MLAARESQCTGFSCVREVAGTVNSKSSATKFPAKVGEEKDPAAVPLKLAFPSTRKGRFAGPPRARTSGRHSSRFDVEIEKRKREDSASIPSAATLDDGVVTLNCVSSRESFAGRYLPCKWAVIGNSRLVVWAGGATSKPKPISALAGVPFQKASTLPLPIPAGLKPSSGCAGTSRAAP